MTAEVKTFQPKATGIARVTWSDRYNQSASVTADPHRDRFSLRWERRWGPQLTDHSNDDLPVLTRAGAEALRDALSAALDWTPEEGSQ